MKKIILIVGLVILVLIIGIGGLFYYMSMQPLYKPGMVSQGENLSAPLSPPAQPAGEQTWLVESGIELAHFSKGGGPKNVLMIHGGPGQPDTQAWSGLETLGEDYTFHYYAQRGSGESSRPIDRFESANLYQNIKTLDQQLGIGAQIADIERIRQILGQEKLILIGHSFGGFLASLYAAEFPEHVEALVLLAPANVLVMPQPDAESDLFASVSANLPADQQAEFEAFMKEYMDFNALFEKSEQDLVDMNNKFGEYYIQALDLPTTEDVGNPGGWMVWAQYVSMGQRHDYRSALAKVTAPVLVLHGGDDMQSEAASRLYSDAFPNAQFVVIDNATHFAFEEQPEAFAQAVGTFFDSIQ
jgi:proline iminopeptidase